MNLKGLQFSKLHGTGNSFVFIDLRQPTLAKAFKKLFGSVSRKQLAKLICDLNFGVGADGFAIFEPLPSKKNSAADITAKWDFYNSDGSKAEMCGNAARCAGLYLSERPGQTIHLQTGAGPVFIYVHSKDQIAVTMSPVRRFDVKQSISGVGRKVQYDFINTGVPHAVIADTKFKITDPYRTLSRAFQKHSKFGKASTNVTFYREVKPGHIFSATFERGVFDFTKACGTGAVAAAISYFHKQPQLEKVFVEVPGGQLAVDFTHETPVLIGPARYVADLFLYRDDLLK